MILKTKLCDLLQVEYPIVQAPIGSATTPELASAVSNAGGLGMLAITWSSPSEVVKLLERTFNLTDRPFGVNVVLEWPQDTRVSLALESGVRIISTTWGDPTPYLPAVHEAGALLVHTVGSLREALRAAVAGVDVLVAQGVEAGGHVRGATSSIDLLASILERLPDLPVVLAGGIATARDIVAALSAGAAGVWLGTRFLCSSEANVSEVYQQAILDAAEGDTVLTMLFDKGWPGARHRVLRNSTVRAWEAAGSPEGALRPGEHDTVALTADGAAIERYSDVIPTRTMTGNLEALALYAGESAARIHDVRPAGQIIEDLVHGVQQVHR